MVDYGSECVKVIARKYLPEVSVFIYYFNLSNFIEGFHVKSLIRNFMNIRQLGFLMLRADGQTDKQI